MRYLIILTLILWSCSTEKRAQSGLEKFQRNGGKFECNIDTIKVPVIVKGKDGVNTIEYKDSIVTIEKTSITPKWVIRFDNKRFEDSLNHVRKLYKDSIQYETKVLKIEGKTQIKVKKVESNRLNWFVFGFVSGVCLSVLLFIFFNRIKKRLI